jgi:hypothetical protein
MTETNYTEKNKNKNIAKKFFAMKRASLGVEEALA